MAIVPARLGAILGSGDLVQPGIDWLGRHGRASGGSIAVSLLIAPLILIGWSPIQIIVDSLNRTDLDLRKTLYGNIILSGGSTLCRGERAQKPFA